MFPGDTLGGVVTTDKSMMVSTISFSASPVPPGSLSPQCDNHGQCSCKPGMTGEKCDRCELEFTFLSGAGSRGDGQLP